MKKKHVLIGVIFVFGITVLGACDSANESSSKADNTAQADSSFTQSTDEETTSTNSLKDSPSNNKTTTQANENNNYEDNTAEDTNKSKENTGTTVTNEDYGSAGHTETNQEEPKDSTNNIHISSGTKAIEYLKGQIEEGKNENIIFDDMGGTLETDDKGSYYTVELISKSLQKSGGSGTVNIYYVYQDGTYQSKY